MPFIVDLSSGNIEREDRTAEKGHYGGSVLGLRLLSERTAAGLDPYDPRALLYVAAGMLGGTHAPGLAKAVFLAKSPLTGAAGEAHALGPFAAGMRAAGARALAVTGRAERVSYLLIQGGEVSVRECGELSGLGVAAATDALRERHGEGAHVAAIGPAGENLVRYASVVTDYAFAAGRYGLGAVFGAKNLKAIVCVGSGAPAQVADPGTVAALGAYYQGARHQSARRAAGRRAGVRRVGRGHARPRVRLRPEFLRAGAAWAAGSGRGGLRRAGGGHDRRLSRLS
ncbi:aldehyde ferredoxin oxidoreductase N-terminal domain-containing protein [Nonomuraea salmonea]|uniref:aldehyde ferredoxin oxidoreductase N-terminal domain-containing protein n=1 Tax=Nonomuraea salmonea TaxID=46181 RepID=UPI00361782CE